MAETPENPILDLVRQARERLKQELQTQAEHLRKLEQSLQELRERHQQLEGAIEQELETLEKVELPAPPPAVSVGSLEQVLGAVRNLMTATLPEQVLEVATEEAGQMGVRAAVFDVRGKAAWGSAASGFGPQLSEKGLRGLVVPLSQEGPFRQVYETGGHVDASADALKRNRNVLDKFKPDAHDPILLLPIRSAGSVSAIFYADPGGQGNTLPTDALKIVTEFAGAQLDRLMALSGGVPSAPEEAEEVEAEPVEVAEEAEVPEAVQAPVTEAAAVEVEGVAVPEAAPPPPVTPPLAASPPTPTTGFDISQLSEAEQKAHKDAKRFARLLVSEIELYNKAKVADGRKNKDLYNRLKSDIDRSRQTFEKRFSKSVGKQFDYFHDELVRTLAANDSSVLGSDYPGPSA